MKITFLGACGMVTGSCYLVQHGSQNMLVDCGLVQGEHFTDDVNYDPFPFDPADLDVVLLTHAHVDHCGRIPRLVREGFHGKIIATHATLDFAHLMLDDSAHIIEIDAQANGYPPLYTSEDVKRMKTFFVGTEYGATIRIGEISAIFFDAGHILGSAFIRLQAGERSVVFSGDLGNPPVPLLRPTEPCPQANAVVMESTYGNRIHEESRERKLILASAIYETATMRGTLLIPAFALERTQELLYELNDLVEHHEIPPLPIFIDSPLAIQATNIYRRYNHLFNQETQYLIRSGDDIFQFPGLHFTRTTQESRAIRNIQPPKIIIAGSGMMHGGRIRHHAKEYLPDFRNQLLIVGFQVSGSLGRKILDGEKHVIIDGEPITVAAKVRAIGAYSAHADKPKLLRWIETATSHPNIYLTHGERPQAQILAEALTKAGYTATIPDAGQRVDV